MRILRWRNQYDYFCVIPVYSKCKSIIKIFYEIFSCQPALNYLMKILKLVFLVNDWGQWTIDLGGYWFIDLIDCFTKTTILVNVVLNNVK